MFKNNAEDEADFCEAYKSQILNNTTEREESSFNTFSKILTILLLLIIIVAVSIYGYNYILDNENKSTVQAPPSSMQIDDDDLIVTDEEEEQQPESLMPPIEESKKDDKLNTLGIDEKMINDVKLAIAQTDKNLIKELEKVDILEVPSADTQSPLYIEELAQLSKETD